MKSNEITFKSLQKYCDNNATWHSAQFLQKFIIQDIPFEILNDLKNVDTSSFMRILPKENKIILFGKIKILLKGTLIGMKHDLHVQMTRKGRLLVERATSLSIKSVADKCVHGTPLQSANM